MRVDGDAESYWKTTLPAMLIISIGMAGAVAPLTSAVLASVEANHVGVASGFNSAAARLGSLVATACASVALAVYGQAVVELFRAAMAACSVAAAAAAVSVIALFHEAPKPAPHNAEAKTPARQKAQDRH